MTLSVLACKSDISKARSELVAMGASTLDTALQSVGRKLGLVRGVKIGDRVKSWDVLQTVRFLNTSIARNDPVLDIGSYASEIVTTLHKLGYTNLSGADLNPDLVNMPHQDRIRYAITDFMNTGFPDASFAAVTSISVIEHGYEPERLLREMSRLLRPAGYFIASFDYWPQKIDTGDTKFFGMDWRIFSKEEVGEFVHMAQEHDLSPVGELKFEGQDRPIECGGQKYTFGWLALRKR